MNKNRHYNPALRIAILTKFGTQADFAAEVKTHKTVVSEVVCGHRNLSADQKNKWAKKLEKPIEELWVK